MGWKRKERRPCGRDQSSGADKAVAGPIASGRPVDISLGHSRQLATFLAAGLIVLATVAAFSNSLTGPLIFDDVSDIVENVSIRHLWPIWDVFVVPNASGATLHGRPVVNLSLAVNYAAGGLNPLAYHLTNVLIHILAGLTLFGIVRRTLLLPSLAQRFNTAATPLALAIALIWSLHPLQTGAVTYVIQRYESMMGLFYLLALYAVIRCGTSERPRLWAAAAVIASLLAMGCKEVAVSVPLTILLYDRAFLAGSFQEAWSQRRGLYVGLAATWAAFVVLLLFSHSRSGWAGYNLPISWIAYARSQFGVILHYLRLSFWPHPLVLDYGWPVARTAGEILPGLILIGGLVALTICALIRWPKWGFLGAWFFLILAPSSSIMPIADLAFEHRMYLPLAAVVTGVIAAGYFLGQWFVCRQKISLLGLQVVDISLVLCVAIALGIATFRRNIDYHSELSIWQDTVNKSPGNERAHNNIGGQLFHCQQIDDAMAHYQQALNIRPEYADAHNNLGLALHARGQLDEAIAQYQKAIEIKPDYADAHYYLGNAQVSRGRVDEAIAHYQKALKIRPDHVDAHNNLGTALAGRGQIDEAIAHYQKALIIRPDYADAYYNLGNAQVSLGRPDEAIAQYQKALKINPDYAEAHSNLGAVMAQQGKLTEAIAHFQKALEIRSDDAKIRYNLGNAFRQQGRLAEAIPQYQKTLEIKPDYVDAHNNLGNALAICGQFSEAMAHYRKALEIKPGDAVAHNNLRTALDGRERLYETVGHYQKALKINPDDADVLNKLAWLRATCPEVLIRNGAEAVELAERAVKLSGGREPAILDTLAAAYAEAGRFSEAVETAQKAIDFAARQNNQALTSLLRVRIKLYQAGSAYRSSVAPPLPQ
jgi:protein O-mannosyl-transferase